MLELWKEVLISVLEGSLEGLCALSLGDGCRREIVITLVGLMRMLGER